MFAKQVGFLFILIIAVMKCGAQDAVNDSVIIADDIFSVIQDDTYGGKINFYQNPSLHVLVDKNTRLNRKNGLQGYRIQIYSGSGVNARDESNQIREYFLELFPEFDSDLVYFDYQAPYFKVSVGDYRTRNEAVEFYHMLKKNFRSSYIINAKINFPKLDLPEEK